MIASFPLYEGTTSTWADSTGSTCDTTISIDFNSTSYCTNFPVLDQPKKNSEHERKQLLRVLNRELSIEAALDLKDRHNLLTPATRSGALSTKAHRRPAQRRSITAVRNWRPR